MKGHSHYHKGNKMNVAARIYSQAQKDYTLRHIGYDFEELVQRGLKVGDVFRAKDIKTKAEINNDYAYFNGSLLTKLVNYGVLEVVEKKTETIEIEEEDRIERAGFQYFNEKGERVNLWDYSRDQIAEMNLTKKWVEAKNEIKKYQVEKKYNVYRLLTLNIKDVNSNIANFVTERVNA
jgi:hypothetical protein